MHATMITIIVRMFECMDVCYFKSCMYVYATFDHQLLRTIGRTFCVREIVKFKKRRSYETP